MLVDTFYFYFFHDWLYELNFSLNIYNHTYILATITSTQYLRLKADDCIEITASISSKILAYDTIKTKKLLHLFYYLTLQKIQHCFILAFNILK